MSDAKRTVGEPHDRLTRCCAAMTAALEAHPEYSEDVKCVVFLTDPERGGLQMHGYEQDAEAISDVFSHLKAVFEANGSTLMFAPLGEG
jgi:hypothetical protein